MSIFDQDANATIPMPPPPPRNTWRKDLLSAFYVLVIVCGALFAYMSYNGSNVDVNRLQLDANHIQLCTADGNIDEHTTTCITAAPQGKQGS